MCSNLLQQNIPATLIAQLPGHKSVQSLSNYATASLDQQKEMCNILQGNVSVEKVDQGSSEQDHTLTPSSNRNSCSGHITAKTLSPSAYF